MNPGSQESTPLITDFVKEFVIDSECSSFRNQTTHQYLFLCTFSPLFHLSGCWIVDPSLIKYLSKSNLYLQNNKHVSTLLFYVNNQRYSDYKIPTMRSFLPLPCHL